MKSLKIQNNRFEYCHNVTNGGLFLKRPKLQHFRGKQSAKAPKDAYNEEALGEGIQSK